MSQRVQKPLLSDVDQHAANKEFCFAEHHWASPVNKKELLQPWLWRTSETRDIWFQRCLNNSLFKLKIILCRNMDTWNYILFSKRKTFACTHKELAFKMFVFQTDCGLDVNESDDLLVPFHFWKRKVYSGSDFWNFVWQIQLLQTNQNKSRFKFAFWCLQKCCSFQRKFIMDI